MGVGGPVHLVDIINQSDLVENPDGEDKLEKPLVKLTSGLPWRAGTLNLFMLPYFRERGRGKGIREKSKELDHRNPY